MLLMDSELPSKAGGDAWGFVFPSAGRCIRIGRCCSGLRPAPGPPGAEGGVGLPCAPPPPKFRSPAFCPPRSYFSQERLKRDLSPNDPNRLICNGRNLVIATSGRERSFGRGPGGLRGTPARRLCIAVAVILRNHGVLSRLATRLL